MKQVTQSFLEGEGPTLIGGSETEVERLSGVNVLARVLSVFRFERWYGAYFCVLSCLCLLMTSVHVNKPTVKSCRFKYV